MSYALLNLATSDGYSAAVTLLCGGASTIALTVANAAAIYQLGKGIASPVWDTEQFALPGVWTLPGADAIRIRSAAVGKPAQISVNAI